VAGRNHQLISKTESKKAAVTVECLPLVPAQGGEVEQSVGVSSGAAVTVECLPDSRKKCM